MNERASKPVIIHTFVYGSLSMSSSLLVGGLRMFTHSAQLVRKRNVVNARVCSYEFVLLTVCKRRRRGRALILSLFFTFCFSVLCGWGRCAQMFTEGIQCSGG